MSDVVTPAEDVGKDRAASPDYMLEASEWGVSVVVCCHNSAERLPQTLAHLAAQVVPEELRWEVIVVDNASTDATAEVATASWPAGASAPLRIVAEPQPGLSYARDLGFAEARYEIVSFVDDDNWVCPEWVCVASDVMSEHADVGACGGLIEPVYEAHPPPWAEHFIRRYAVGDQGAGQGYVVGTRGWLWGAGLTVRRSAWRQLSSRGFRSLLVGRTGACLTSGEDVELCLALRLAGWRLWYEPRLRMQHFLSARRLNWSYLRRLHRAFGAAHLGLSPYFYAVNERDRAEAEGVIQTLRRSWHIRALVSLLRLLPRGYTVVVSRFTRGEGDARVLQVEHDLGRLGELLRQRGSYGRRIRDVSDARWWRADSTMHEVVGWASSTNTPVVPG